MWRADLGLDYLPPTLRSSLHYDFYIRRKWADDGSTCLLIHLGYIYMIQSAPAIYSEACVLDLIALRTSKFSCRWTASSIFVSVSAQRKLQSALLTVSSTFWSNRLSGPRKSLRRKARFWQCQIRVFAKRLRCCSPSDFNGVEDELSGNIDGSALPEPAIHVVWAVDKKKYYA